MSLMYKLTKLKERVELDVTNALTDPKRSHRQTSGYKKEVALILLCKCQQCCCSSFSTKTFC